MQPVLPAFLIARWLLLLLLAAGVYFLKGFLVPVLAALIIGLAGWPLYKRLVVRCNGRTALAATLALLVVIVVLVVPLSLALSVASLKRRMSCWEPRYRLKGVTSLARSGASC